MAAPTRQNTVKQDMLALFLPVLPPSQIISDWARRTVYRYDGSGRGAVPDLVLLPRTIAELRACVELCMSHQLPVIMRGSGTNLCGGTTASETGVVIVTTGLTKISPVDRENLTLTAEPGVLTKSLESLLQPMGLFYALDPGSYHVSTLGGNLAENSGGIHSIRYGVTTQHVLTVQVLLADGSVLTTPPAGDYRPVLDITVLIIGSEGALAITEAATLPHALWMRPAGISST